MIRRGRLAAVASAAMATLALAPSAVAQPQPYQENDFGGFRNILPPGQGQTLNATELAQALGGTTPPFFDDQREMYEDLVYATPGLADDEIDSYFKDGSFGTLPADVIRTYSPANRSGLTVQRDQYNVPHIYGESREDVMFGAGYVGAEDRLFFMDVLRHAGRAKLSSFAGPSNKPMDASQWDVAPYTEADLQRQIDLADEVYGAEGVELVEDLNAYVAGVNQYISEARLDPVNKMPGEYAAILKPSGPTDWKGTDVIATASLIGGIFGKGGGGELGNAEVYNAAKARFGAGPGTAVWSDFRHANDPEAPTTVHGTSFPYQDRPGTDPTTNPAVSIPDPGSLVDGSPDDAPPSLGGLVDGILGGLPLVGGGSNALLVSGDESESGTPIAVFGPQVSYFAPQILMEQDMHGPDIDARGATFVGVNLYVLLGRGQDYAWSATSAGQDIIDTFADPLCEPGGGAPTINSMHYRWKGQCRPIEVLENVQLTNPNPGDPNPPVPEVYRLEAQRTVHGIVSKRGTVNGQPVVFSKLRSTYYHEADSARAFSALNRPSRVQDADDFARVMSKINFTFNWFYADDRDISYFNSGDNPVRAPGVDPEFPTNGNGSFDWQGWDPVLPENGLGLEGGTNVADYAPFAEHPQVTHQDYISSWNNKQAPGYRAAEDQYSFGPLHRVDSLDERIENGIVGGNKMSLTELIDAMEDAGTVDLRGAEVLPEMLDVIRRGTGGVPAGISDEVALLDDWTAERAHRRDADQDGSYDDSEAVALMDAWWPRALEAAFKPTLGDDLFEKLRAQNPFDDPPGPVGSAYISGWFGYMDKDLRSLLGRPVNGPYSRGYCGGGDLDDCAAALATSLQAAVDNPPDYGGETGCLDDGRPSDAQLCHDTVEFRAVGGASVPEIHWINRPTWQQVVEIQGHRGRGEPVGGDQPGPGTGTASDGPCATDVVGSRGKDRLNGTALGERIVGLRKGDRLSGGDGDDCLLGQGGRDRLVGGAGADLLSGGTGADRIRARDGERDRIRCGRGKDSVKADKVDKLSRSCE